MLPFKVEMSKDYYDHFIIEFSFEMKRKYSKNPQKNQPEQ